MSPEQASGKPLDHRSDQFSLGAILYEMATGRRAFQKNTPVETLTAIIREDPEPVGTLNPRAPAPLRWTIERCLAKNPEERYVSTRDLARDLASLRDHLSEGSTAASPFRRSSRPAPSPPAGTRRGGASGCGRGRVVLPGRARGKDTDPLLPAPDLPAGPHLDGAVYSGRKDGRLRRGLGRQPRPALLDAPGNPESIPFALPAADVLAISSSGELALSLGRHYIDFWEAIGTLARVALSGNAPREIAEDVLAADWAPNGTDLAVVHAAGGRMRLEYPIGNSLTRPRDGSATRACPATATSSHSSTTPCAATTPALSS